MLGGNGTILVEVARTAAASQAGLQNVAFFLYARHPKSGELVGPVGTGVLLAVPLTRVSLLDHTYAVTCHHCILQAARSLGSHRAGKSRENETDPEAISKT
jgi:hypothetical protein